MVADILSYTHAHFMACHVKVDDQSALMECLSSMTGEICQQRFARRKNKTIQGKTIFI